MSLPYVELPRIADHAHIGWLKLGPYFWLLLSSSVVGAMVTRWYADRLGVPRADRRWLGLAAALAALVGAHLFDVAWYQWDRAVAEPALWYQLTQGISVYGAFVGIAVVVALTVRARRLDPRVYADLAAVGAAVAVTLGRIGCALTHDHPGRPTASVLGVDYPAWLARAHHLGADPVRLFDLGLLELLLMVPVAAVALHLAFAARRRLPAGALSAGLAIVYAGLRIVLDSFRLSSTEPTRAGLTAGQWASLLMLPLALVALRRVVLDPRIAPLAAELAGAPGGRRPDLPRATARRS